MLVQFVRQHRNLPADQILAAVNARSVERRDDDLWHWTGLAEQVGLELVGQLDVILDNPGSKWVRESLAGHGLQISSSLTQAALEGMRPVLGDVAVASLKAVGIWYVSPWQNAGNAGDATLEQVQDAIITVENEEDTIAAAIARNNLRDQVSTRATVTLNQIASGEIANWEEARAFLGAE